MHYNACNRKISRSDGANQRRKKPMPSFRWQTALHDECLLKSTRCFASRPTVKMMMADPKMTVGRATDVYGVLICVRPPRAASSGDRAIRKQLAAYLQQSISNAAAPSRPSRPHRQIAGRRRRRSNELLRVQTHDRSAFAGWDDHAIVTDYLQIIRQLSQQCRSLPFTFYLQIRQSYMAPSDVLRTRLTI